MKRTLSLFCFFGLNALIPAASASTLILSDNFNGRDNTNFDESDQTGRRGGLLGPSVQLRSSRIQQQISGNQLLANAPANPTGGSGRIRFQEAASLPTNVWHDFASGPAGAAILLDGGFRVEFDWTPTGNTVDRWVSFSVGIAAQPVAPVSEPSTRVNDGQTDFGILFRENGASQFFDNGVAVTGGSFAATTAARHVLIDYTFNSFADGSSVGVAASVNGTNVATRTFDWDSNSGVLYMELGSYQNGTLFDNFSLSSLSRVPEPSTWVLGGLLAAGAVLRRRRS